jgi:hypothetical protein
MKRSLLLIGFLSLSLNLQHAPSVAASEPKNYLMQSCETTPDLACIESLSASSESGLKAAATSPISTRVIGSDADAESYQEWELSGFKFEGSSGNRVIPRITFRPFGATQCNFDQCFKGLEEIQVGIEPSWYIRSDEDLKSQVMDLSRRGTNLLCGDAKSPTLCYRAFNFNQKITFEITMRVPSDFYASAILGSVKNLSFTEDGSDKALSQNGFRRMTVKFDPQMLQRPLFSALVPDPMNTSDYADFEADQANFWIIGKRNFRAQSLGNCATVPFISVLSNSIYQEMPTWNASNQSVEVALQAPHFTTKGDLHRGYFEASISQAMGKCLWGIDLSKKSIAKLSISYPTENGSEVQTVLGRFDGKNYILFSANFHYSAPTLSLKMVSDELKSVTCTKGKLKKVVKAAKPKCPAGFKKAS